MLYQIAPTEGRADALCLRYEAALELRVHPPTIVAGTVDGTAHILQHQGGSEQCQGNLARHVGFVACKLIHNSPRLTQQF